MEPKRDIFILITVIVLAVIIFRPNLGLFSVTLLDTEQTVQWKGIDVNIKQHVEGSDNGKGYTNTFSFTDSGNWISHVSVNQERNAALRGAETRQDITFSVPLKDVTKAVIFSDLSISTGDSGRGETGATGSIEVNAERCAISVSDREGQSSSKKMGGVVIEKVTAETYRIKTDCYSKLMKVSDSIDVMYTLVAKGTSNAAGGGSDASLTISPIEYTLEGNYKPQLVPPVSADSDVMIVSKSLFERIIFFFTNILNKIF